MHASASGSLEVKPLCLQPLDGDAMFGFDEMLVRWIENLPGSSNCIDYQYRNLLIAEKPGDAMLINPNKSGCARSEGYNQKLHKRFKGISKMLRQSRRTTSNGGTTLGGIGSSMGSSGKSNANSGGSGSSDLGLGFGSGRNGSGSGSSNIGGGGGGGSNASGGGSSVCGGGSSSSVTTASSSTSAASSRRAERAKMRDGSASMADQRRDEREGQSLPVAMQYRRLLQSRNSATKVGKSGIQGRGLYARTAIKKGEMVIEYVGEVIRKELTEYRERYYNSRGIGCYMFTQQDTDYVVDATMKGGQARFINHSCEPNCESKLLAIEEKKKIMILALRDIEQEEEITYDYMFEFDPEDKVACLCGAPSCTGWMN